MFPKLFSVWSRYDTRMRARCLKERSVRNRITRASETAALRRFLRDNLGGALTAADFARLCGVRAHQVGGVVARMGVLNADGFAIVEHDVAGRRVVLHKARLVSQFGVSE